MFIPPKGLLRLLGFGAGRPQSSTARGPLLTVLDRVIRDGLRFCSVAAPLEGCHEWKMVFAIARASQKGHTDEERRSITLDCPITCRLSQKVETCSCGQPPPLGFVCRVVLALIASVVSFVY